MSGSEHSQNEFTHENNDMNANDQSKHGQDSKIGTEIPKGPESKCKDGGNTSINVPDDNVGTDVISPPKGASDDESDEPPVLPSNAPLSGKAIMFQQYLESKNQQEEQEKK
jgi:hypothetical protein